jgi:KDO2-lipid IV(A) lauroyltransferase
MYRVGVAVVRRLPRWFNRLWVRGVAECNYLALGDARRQIAENLTPLLGNDPHCLRQAVRRVFINYGEQLVEYAAFFGGRGTPALDAFEQAEGYEHLAGALALGKGVVLVTAHVGFWELGGLLFRQMGLPVSVLTLEDPDPGVHEERSRIRASLGIETITVGTGPWGSLAVARALRQNSVVAMLVDRYAGSDAVPVEMFGRVTHFAPGPALYARLSGASVVPAFVLRAGPGRYRGLVLPAVPMEFTGDRAGDLAQNTRLVAAAIEGVVRDHPDQWYNFTPVWRTP